MNEVNIDEGIQLSIVIVSFNTKGLLKDCLISLKMAAKNLQSEIFVVDNNSQDGSAQTVRRQFPWVKLIANSVNRGFSKANNQAIKRARGKYILILNPDTKVLPETLTKMTKFMEQNPQIGVATCRVELPDGALDVDCRRHFPTPWRSFCHFSNLAKIFKGSKIFDQYNYGYLSAGFEHEIDACMGAFMIIPRSLIRRVGMFDEDFFFYGEDLDWCFRFREAGYKVVYTPRTKIIHYKGAASGIKKNSQHLSRATKESKKRALVESTRAMRLFYQKHYKNKYPKPLTWLVFTAIKLIEIYRLSKV